MSMGSPGGNVMRAPTAPRIAPQASAAQFRSAPIVRSQPNNNFRSPVARAQRGEAPSIAFGGHPVDGNNNNAAINAQARRNFGTATPTQSQQQQQFAVRQGGTREYRVPSETSRRWDQGRIHEWNHHHYRYYGGGWIVTDSGLYDGYAYDNGYGYGYDNGDTAYSSGGYTPEVSSGSLMMNAQDRLNRLGYSAGAADGVMGPQTRDAIADFQNDNHLPATGYLDTATVQA